MKTKTSSGYTVKGINVQGKELSINAYFKELLKGQDIHYWKEHSLLFDQWVKDHLKQRIDNMTFIIE